MSKRSKAKGSTYEREFVSLVDECGLPAQRVPLSGAMAGYKDDVVVCDEVRVECKYRADGGGFKRLHDWHPGPGQVLHLPESGLYVYRIEDWCDVVRYRIDSTTDYPTPMPELEIVTKSVTRQKTMLDWMGEADALALRRPRHLWLVCEKELPPGPK